MPRTTEPVARTERGDDTHPAFGLLRVNRHSVTPGAVLFDSDIRHGRTVVVTLTRATRKRDLNRDWIHEEELLFEVEMSEAQWASFVSSMGSFPTPVTIRAVPTDLMVPGLEYDPRLAHSMDEVKTAAAKAFGQIQAAVAAYDALPKTATAKERREAMDAIRNATRHAQANVNFASESLVEHAENVVQRSRADIEAMAMRAAQQMGLPTGTRLLELDGPEEEAQR